MPLGSAEAQQSTRADDPAAPLEEAGAAAKTTIAVTLVGTDRTGEVAAARLERTAWGLLHRSPTHEPREPREVLDPRAGERSARRAEGRAALRVGSQAYDNLDMAGALDAFSEAVEAFERSDLSRSFDELTEAQIRVAATHIGQGDGRSARQVIERLITLAPELRLPPAYFPPEFLAYAERVRLGINRSGGKTVEVRSTPAGAEVYLDGQLRGVTPLTLKRVPAGEHYVTLVAPGHALSQRRTGKNEMDVRLQPLEHVEQLEAALASLREAGPDSPPRAAARSIGGRLGAREMVVGKVGTSASGGSMEVGLWRYGADGELLGRAMGQLPLEGAWVEAFVATFQKVLAPLPRAMEGVSTHTTPPGQARVGEPDRLPAWLLLGAGVALAATSTYAGLQAQSASTRFGELPQRSGDAAALAGEGRTWAIVADVGWVLSAASAAAGGWLFFTTPSGDEIIQDEGTEGAASAVDAQPRAQGVTR